MKLNHFKQTLKYFSLCVRIMQLRENSNFLRKKKQYVTFCLSALVKWNTQAYLKLLLHFTYSVIAIKEKEIAWNIMNQNHKQQGALWNQ